MNLKLTKLFRYTVAFIALGAIFLLTACQGLFTPPREATRTAATAVAPTNTLPPEIIPAPTATPGGIIAPEAGTFQAPNQPTLTVWVNENSPAHEDVLREMAVEFGDAHSVTVEMRLIASNLLPDLVETAVISPEYDLPDILIFPLDYAVNWAERGVLDTAVTAQALDAIGRDTFDPNALAFLSGSGQPAALPSDGYPQITIYRTDWFADKGLNAPDNFTTMFNAAEALYDPENFIAGFVAPTESNLVSTHRIFEHIALANGCQLIDEIGRIQLLQPVCQDALNFYYDIIHNYSPIGVQTDTSTRDAYLSGRAGLVMAGPQLLLQLAGLDDAHPPVCPECAATPDFLAQNSAVLATLRGRGAQASPTSFASMTVLGMTSQADAETAVAFAQYWFDEGYERWLAVEPERKIPLHWGTAVAPRRYIDAWGSTPLQNGGPSLQDIYGADTVAALQEALASNGRWGFSQGQGALIGEVYRTLTFSIVLQEMLSGYFGTEKTLVEAYNRVVDLIPNYPYEEVGTP